MDKKIQDAASDHLPPYQEKDWDRMESMLNKHLPQEKKKRPFLFGLTFLLLAGIPVLFIMTTYKRPPAFVAQRISTDPADHRGSSSGSENPGPTPADISGDGEHPITESQASGNNFNTGLSNPVQPGYPAKPRNVSGNSGANAKGKAQASPDLSRSTNSRSELPANTAATSVKEKEDPAVVPGTTVLNAPAGTEKNDPPVSGAIADSTADKDSLPAKEKEAEEKKKAKDENRSGKLQINFSAGPDLSTIGISKAGQWRMQYGIGASYALSRRLQVRTGFFISRKLYTADSSDYHPPKNFWSYYTNVQKIDADCLVYEIPLNIIYSFPSAKKHQWFISAGISSYLMKEENYDYYYKNALGVIEYRSRSIKNENDHFFSIVQLSGGYQHHFSNKLSLMAEPYFKFPVSGVGFGKVKLNNTGMLFTLGYKPFLRKER